MPRSLIFVEDVETVSPQMVNLAEKQQNGHTLIHAHLCEDGVWGILQPCVFGKPRVWTQKDRIITHLEKRITPLAVAYVKAIRF